MGKCVSHTHTQKGKTLFIIRKERNVYSEFQWNFWAEEMLDKLNIDYNQPKKTLLLCK